MLNWLMEMWSLVQAFQQGEGKTSLYKRIMQVAWAVKKRYGLNDFAGSLTESLLL